MTFDLLLDIIIDTLLDCAKMLPFLFFAFLLMEALEHKASEKINRALASSGKAGPLVGALLGCVPQCGFSVFSANLFSNGVITLGTLIAVFLSTSDEAVLIILSHPDRKGEILKLLAVKIVIAIFFGYIINLIVRKHPGPEKHIEDHCKDCGCHDEHGGIFKPAVKHTLKILGFLLIIVFVLNLAVEWVGMERLSKILLSNSVFQPFIAGLIGLIPNCAASIFLTELYLKGAISFASVIAGLSTGAGAGLLVLFKENKFIKENIKIILILYACAVTAGVVVSFLPV
ncbi:MAG: hypothetical protein E7514_06840 [Ruminococcaceae bacterium]|nr:hypothetical protein [Oscillospiraceae bacterium]